MPLTCRRLCHDLVHAQHLGQACALPTEHALGCMFKVGWRKLQKGRLLGLRDSDATICHVTISITITIIFTTTITTITTITITTITITIITDQHEEAGQGRVGQGAAGQGGAQVFKASLGLAWPAAIPSLRLLVGRPCWPHPSQHDGRAGLAPGCAP